MTREAQLQTGDITVYCGSSLCDTGVNHGSYRWSDWCWTWRSSAITLQSSSEIRRQRNASSHQGVRDNQCCFSMMMTAICATQLPRNSILCRVWARRLLMDYQIYLVINLNILQPSWREHDCASRQFGSRDYNNYHCVEKFSAHQSPTMGIQRIRLKPVVPDWIPSDTIEINRRRSNPIASNSKFMEKRLDT